MGLQLEGANVFAAASQPLVPPCKLELPIALSDTNKL